MVNNVIFRRNILLTPFSTKEEMGKNLSQKVNI